MASLRRGILITIEGIDGVGKTTHTRMLVEYLREKSYDVVQLREPTNGSWGRKLRDLTKHGRSISPKEECQWFLQDRIEDVKYNITPALEERKIVIMDRYYYSNIAYQGALGLDTDKIREANEQFAPRPDLVIVLDAPPETGLSRITDKRCEALNTFETLEYQTMVREKFLSMSSFDNVLIMDGARSCEEVQKDIRSVVAGLIISFMK